MKSSNSVKSVANSHNTADLLTVYQEYVHRAGKFNSQHYKSNAKKFCDFLRENEIDDCNQFIQQQLTEVDIALYSAHIKLLFETKKIPVYSAQQRITVLRHFFEFLYNEGYLKQKILVPRVSFRTPKARKKAQPPKIVELFLENLKQKNYAITHGYRVNVTYFVKYVWPDHVKDQKDIPIQQLQKEHIIKYENFLLSRVNCGEITIAGVYKLLLHLVLFLNFLSEQGIVHIRYSIPEKFREQYHRSNAYIPTEDAILLLDTILKMNRLKERNLALVLVLLDTGCRVSEAANINIEDINLTEGTLSLYSKKSGKRTLKLAKAVVQALKDYIANRAVYSPETQTLFVTQSGTPVTSKVISQILQSLNRKAFGELRHPPKAFRHTYVTNAIDESYDLSKISKVVGHKHLISTMNYLHTSSQRLLDHTMPFDPTQA